jgi:tetratricopeptide (TPR) repeat protein
MGRRHHPNREILSRFTAGELPPDEARRVERHLAVCSDCLDRADELAVLTQLELLDSWLRPGYDEAFERATERTAEQLAGFWGEGRSAEDLFTELLRAPVAKRRRQVRDEQRFHSLKLCELLRSQSREKWFSDPSAGLDLAELAVEVAEHLDPARYGSHLVADARTLSWACLGNGFRVMSDLWRAGKALHRAWILQLQDDGDPYSKAELLNFTSSLLNAQNRFDEAIRLNDLAISLYREVEDHHLEGAMLIQKGRHLSHQGRDKDAILLFRKGLNQIDPEKDPRLFLAGKHNLIRSLSLTGTPEQAWRLLKKNRPLYHDLGDRMALVRLGWLEGNVARELGRLIEAEASLLEAREVFSEYQLGANVLFVSLELAEIYAKGGRHRQIREILGEVIPLGEAMGLRQDVLMAKLLYEQASRR